MSTLPGVPVAAPPDEPGVRLPLWLKVARSSVFVLGLLVCLVGIIGFTVALWMCIDPVAVKMTDDHDPFGVPPALWHSAWLCVVYLGIFFVGRLMMLARVKPRRKYDVQRVVATVDAQMKAQG